MFQCIPPTTWLAVVIVGAIILWSAILRLREELKIRHLGGHGRRIWPYDPFGIYFTYAIISHAIRDENLRFMYNCCHRNSQPGSKRSNTFEWRMGGKRFIMTSDKVNIKAMLATQFKEYGKGENFQRNWGRLLGRGIFASDGDEWHGARNRLRVLFTRQRIMDLTCFEHHIQVLLPMLESGRAVDIKDTFSRLFLDITVDFAFGSRLSTLQNQDKQFFEAFQRILHTQSLIERAGPFNVIIPRKQFHQDIGIMDSIFKPFIQQAITRSANGVQDPDSKPGPSTFLDQCSALSCDPKFLRDEMMGTLIAGRDPTANTLTWCFYELACNPAVVVEIRRTIEESIGMNREPTLEELKGLKIVTHVIQETLRLYPVLPFNVRAALNDTTLPHGGGLDGGSPIGVPAGTTVYYSTQLLQLNPMMYPAENTDFPPAHEFAPSRWATWAPEPWTYIPFNGGPRVCVGQTLAITEMAYVLVRIFQYYSKVQIAEPTVRGNGGDWSRVNGKASVAEKFVRRTAVMASEVTLSAKNPVNLRFLR